MVEKFQSIQKYLQVSKYKQLQVLTKSIYYKRHQYKNLQQDYNYIRRIKMNKRISVFAQTKGIKDPEQIQLIKKALLQQNDKLISQIFTPKKWKQFKQEFHNTQIKTSPIYFRYKNYQKPIRNQKGPVKCIVMGPCGNGKTTLINILSGAELPTGQAATSITRNITQLQSQIRFPNPFVIYDTPGTTAKTDKYEHAAHIKQILQYKPLHCALVVMKFENRGDDLLKSIYQHVKMLPEFEQNILFLVTHIDQANNPQSCVQDIDTMLNEVMPEFKNQIIFYSNLNVDQVQLSKVIYEIASSLPNKKIKIDEITFYKHFNISKQAAQELYFKADLKKFSQEMQNIANAYINYAIKLKDIPEKDALIQDLQVSLKSQMLDIVQKFQKKFQFTMINLDYYESYYYLQNKVLELIHQFMKKLGEKNNLYYMSHSTGQTDIRDLVKQCPNPDCQLIWFRIQSCPNTQCGARPSCFFDFLKKPFYRFRIVRDKNSNEIKVFRLSQNKNQNQVKLQSRGVLTKIKESLGFKNKKHLGCGQNMNFQTLPRLPKIESILKEWYGVHTIEEVIQRFQSDKYIQQTRMLCEAKINRQILTKTIY